MDVEPSGIVEYERASGAGRAHDAAPKELLPPRFGLDRAFQAGIPASDTFVQQALASRYSALPKIQADVPLPGAAAHQGGGQKQLGRAGAIEPAQEFREVNIQGRYYAGREERVECFHDGSAFFPMRLELNASMDSRDGLSL